MVRAPFPEYWKRVELGIIRGTSNRSHLVLAMDFVARHEGTIAMKLTGWHCLLVLIIGYLLGYYFPALAQGTVGKLLPKQGG